MNSPGANGGMNTFKDVVVVAPVVSKLSNSSPAFGALFDMTESAGKSFS